MKTHYQRRIQRENRIKIIQILSKQSLTFKKLIEESGLSRSRVNQHLKSLVAENLVKKEYQNGKIINVLQRSELKPTDNLEITQFALKAKIDDMNQQELKDLDMFSLILYLARYEQIQDDPQHKDDYFKAVENAKKRFSDMKHAMNTIDEAVRHIQEEQAKPKIRVP